MNDSQSSSSFLPVLLLNVALLILLTWQVVLSVQTRSNTKSMVEQRQQLVTQSTALQGNLERLVNDLLELAETDSDARAVVEKYQIRRNNP